MIDQDPRVVYILNILNSLKYGWWDVSVNGHFAHFTSQVRTVINSMMLVEQ